MFFDKIINAIKYRLNIYFLRNIRRLYNTIYYKLRNSEDFIIVNCSFKQWGDYVVPFNIGDDINAVLLHYLSGKKILNYDEFFHKPMVNLMGIGSILDWKSTNDSIVWGSGIMDCEVVIPNQCKPMEVVAVRGVLTKLVLEKNGILCPDVFGDPALLLPNVYQPFVEKSEIIGIIPHYVDLDDPNLHKLLKNNRNVELINIQHYKNWKDVIDQICSCKYIVSSSLHGLILSDAYKVPNVWVKFSDKIVGNDFKYYDYFSAVGRNDICLDMRNIISISELDKVVRMYEKINFDDDLLLSSFPLNLVKR